MSTKKSSSPMQYRIEVGKDVLKRHYRNPDSAYRNYEAYCSIYPDLEVCLFDNLHNEIIYRRDGLTEVLKDVHNPDNRMKYKVVVEFNNGRVDKYRHFKRYDSADKYYCECMDRAQYEDWAGIVKSIKLFDLLSGRLEASMHPESLFAEPPVFSGSDFSDFERSEEVNTSKTVEINFFTKFKNFLKECIRNITDKMNLF